MFGWAFDHPIVLTKHLLTLDTNCKFNQPIVLTKSIIHGTFGSYFNQPIVLTRHITHLTINSNNHYVIGNLPNNIKHLTLGYFFNLPLDNAPSSLTKIITQNKDYMYKYSMPYISSDLYI